VKLAKNGNLYERALTYKLMQAPIMSEVRFFCFFKAEMEQN